MAIVTTKFLEREYSLSPVPVLECSNRDMRKICQNKGISFGEDYGSYYYDIRFGNAPPGLIFINCHLPNYKRLAVFYHELSHVECKSKHCDCFTEYGQSSGMCEYHAQIGALIKCQNSKQLASLLFSVECITNMAVSDLNGEQHKGARLTVEDQYWLLLKATKRCSTVWLDV